MNTMRIRATVPQDKPIHTRRNLFGIKLEFLDYLVNNDHIRLMKNEIITVMIVKVETLT